MVRKVQTEKLFIKHNLQIKTFAYILLKAGFCPSFLSYYKKWRFKKHFAKKIKHILDHMNGHSVTLEENKNGQDSLMSNLQNVTTFFFAH